MKTIQKTFTHLSTIGRLLALLSVFFMFTGSTVAQIILDSQNKVTVALDDGTQVILYGKAKTRDNGFTSEFVYLPTGLRLSQRPDGVPEFLFLKYTTEETEDAGGVQGALMHFLMEWGLTTEQVAEAQVKLKDKIDELNQNPRSKYRGITNPVILGAADVNVEDGNSFRIISSLLTDGEMAKVVASGNATTLPGAKIAVAAKLDKNAAQLMAATFEENRSISDVSIELSFNYDVLFPAVNGKIVIDWKKVEETIETFSSEYTHDRQETKTYKDDTYTYTEIDSVYNRAIERKAVIFEIDQNTTDNEVANQIVESFMNVFTEALTDQNVTPTTAPPTEDEVDENPNARYGASYTYNRTKAEKRYERLREVYNLNYRVAIPKMISLTGNMGSWYDGVRNNPQCVSTVNLNDPFFQHRDINFILDIDTEKIFGEEVNYVTVNVRKRRNSGNDFEDQITIDRNYLQEKGIRAGLTYARGEDNNPDKYEYRMQWSLRGGDIFPDDPDWIVGDWEGVTLSAPISPRTIELETDIDELKENDIVRVTAEVRYYRFENEEERNIPLTVSKEQALVPMTIFTDKDTKGYVYRLIYTHKQEGKLVMPWETKINDNYIYASIPEEFRDTESELFKAAKEAGEEIIETAADTVLDKFKDLIKTD